LTAEWICSPSLATEPISNTTAIGSIDVRTAERIQKCCQEVEQAVLDIDASGEYPSEARVSQLISQPGYFRYKEVRKSLNRAMLDLEL
jgi:hypothetical protein